MFIAHNINTVPHTERPMLVPRTTDNTVTIGVDFPILRNTSSSCTYHISPPNRKAHGGVGNINQSESTIARR